MERSWKYETCVEDHSSSAYGPPRTTRKYVTTCETVRSYRGYFTREAALQAVLTDARFRSRRGQLVWVQERGKPATRLRRAYYRPTFYEGALR